MQLMPRRFTGTASRDDKLAHATSMGCDAVVNYTRDSVSQQVAALTDGQGMDIGLMTIGDATADELIDSRPSLRGTQWRRHLCLWRRQASAASESKNQGRRGHRHRRA